MNDCLRQPKQTEATGTSSGHDTTNATAWYALPPFLRLQCLWRRQILVRPRGEAHLRNGGPRRDRGRRRLAGRERAVCTCWRRRLRVAQGQEEPHGLGPASRTHTRGGVAAILIPAIGPVQVEQNRIQAMLGCFDAVHRTVIDEHRRIDPFAHLRLGHSSHRIGAPMVPYVDSFAEQTREMKVKPVPRRLRNLRVPRGDDV
mmetsp:Transcript_70781/g.229976  ORF Transcript_70781/g.229976 Transcript_70781/m.229976 type:complete len:201 (+) Transcript_70781:46-648(+)